MKSLVDKINAADAARELNRAWFVEQQHIKKNLAPQLWRSLLAVLQEKCGSINKSTKARIVIETINDSEVKLTNAETGAWLHLQYDDGTPCVWFQSPGPSDYYAFKVDDDGSGVKFFDHRNQVALFPDKLAAAFVAMLVVETK